MTEYRSRLCKTVLWLYGFNVGGAERQAFAFAKHLQRSGWADVEVWGFENGGPLARLATEAGILTRVVPIWTHRTQIRDLARAALRAAHALRKARAELVLPYMTPSNILCGLSWRLSGAKACVWNQRNAGVEAIDRRAERLAARLCSALVANSATGGRFLVETLRAPRERVHVIPNAVLLDPPRHDRKEWRERLGVSDSTFIATMTANLNEWKDHETLLRAWALVCTRQAGALHLPQLVLAGSDRGTEAALQALAQELGIAEQVSFLGHVDDIGGLLAATDTAIFLSRFEDSEGCPNAVMEYLAAGLPIIASDTAGPREVLGAELRHALVPPEDAEAVAAQLMRMIENPVARNDWKETGKRRARNAFSLENTFGKYEKLLKSLAGRD